MEVEWKKLRRPAIWQKRRGSPSERLREWWKWAIQEILSSLQDRLQRWTSPTEAGDAPESEREMVPQTYEAALWVAHWKVVETTTALQSDLDRLDNELRGRPWAHSQSGSQCRT